MDDTRAGLARMQQPRVLLLACLGGVSFKVKPIRDELPLAARVSCRERQTLSLSHSGLVNCSLRVCECDAPKELCLSSVAAAPLQRESVGDLAPLGVQTERDILTRL